MRVELFSYAGHTQYPGESLLLGPTGILGCVLTWCVSTSGWASPQNSELAFRHRVLEVFKYHSVPECKVKTLNPNTSTVAEFWCEYLEKRCVYTGVHVRFIFAQQMST